MALWPGFLSFVHNLKNSIFFFENCSDLVGEKKKWFEITNNEFEQRKVRTIVETESKIF